MSYRAPEQSIEEPAIIVVEGIDTFNTAVDARIRSGNWSDKHIDKLTDVVEELSRLRLKLLRLARDNW